MISSDKVTGMQVFYRQNLYAENSYYVLFYILFAC